MPKQKNKPVARRAAKLPCGYFDPEAGPDCCEHVIEATATRDRKIEELRDQITALKKLLRSECEICSERDEYGSCSLEKPGQCGFYDALTTKYRR